MDALSFRPLPSCPLVGGYSRAAPVSMGTRSHRWCHYSPRQARSPEAADAESPAQTEPDALISSNPYLVPSPHLRLWPATQVGDDGERESLRGKSSGEEEEKEGTLEVSAEPVRRRGRGRWFVMILRIRSLFQGQREDGDDGQEGVQDREDAAVSRLLEESDCRAGCCDEEWSEGCHVCGEEEDLRQQQGDQEGWEAIEVNRDSFSTLLRRASMADAKLYEKLSYLGSLAYAIPRINHTSLLKVHGLRFVTSSLEKKLKPADAEAHGGAAGEPKVEVPVEQPVKAKKKQEKQEGKKQEEQEGKKQEQQEGNKQEHQEGSTPFTASDAYRIATAAASYIHNQTKSIIPFQDATGGNQGSSPTKRDDSGRVADEASFVVTTESVTAVVAAKEEVKAAVASDLNSSRTSPCEWFICDDEKTGTRLFVIQGSESLASWQANLLFEPVQFEGLDVVVHRGIYEAAKGMYQQMLPHIQSHLKTRGPAATLRFTGHSLGGSLSLLINLMLLVRGQAPHSALLPVITFGAPSIMCGGDYLLRKLGLPQSHIQAITMHRDIVPRAFSCTYPDRVAEILKALNGSFRKHPCLNQQKLLYAPMGELLILQPGDKFSPGHHLLPSGSGLYFFGQSLSPDSADATRTRRLLRAALSVFLNSPHPLEILGDRSAYGADGAVARDHDMGSYLKAMREVIQVEKQRSREAEKTKRQQQHQLRMLRWPLVGPYVSGARRRRGASGEPFRQIDISNVVNGGMESFRRITKMVDSQNMHLLVMAMLPALGIAQNA